MNPIPFRAGLRMLLCSLLALVYTKSAAQRDQAYIDSLYTYAYFKHRLQLCEQRFAIPRLEHRRLRAAASIADSLAARWPSGTGGANRYLPYWAAHPELDEAAARNTVGLPGPAQEACRLDTAGYAVLRRRLTALKQSAYDRKRSSDTAGLLAVLDTLGREHPFTDAPLQARRLAIAARDTAAYLRAFRLTEYPSFAEGLSKELRWPVATTAEQKSFVTACLRGIDSNTVLRLAADGAALRRCVSHFADLQNLCSQTLVVGRPLPRFLQPHKLKRHRIYCLMVEECYTVMPGLVCRYLNTQGSLSRNTLFEISYLSLHLMQINGKGQIYPDSVFENYLGFIRELAYAGKEDMEVYAALRDEYLTRIKRRPSEYGYFLPQRGEDPHWRYVPSAAVQVRREAEGLVPLEVVAARQ